MSTFVSIGNGTESFSRLLEAVEKIAHQLPAPVIIQHGTTAFSSEYCQFFPFTDEEHFKELIKNADIFITHGGVGSILTALALGKKPIVVPRRKKYNEIINDHQVTFTAEFAKSELISLVNDQGDLTDNLLVAIKANQRTAGINTINSKASYLSTVKARLDNFLSGSTKKFCLVSASGGHLTELRKFYEIYKAHDYFHVINVPIVESDSMKGRTQVITLCQRDWRALINFYEAWQILNKQKPQIILTTGAWPAIPFGIIGRLLGIRVVYVETMAKVITPSATGRAMYYIANDFFYPWEALKPFFPKGTCCGLLIWE